MVNKQPSKCTHIHTGREYLTASAAMTSYCTTYTGIIITIVEGYR